MPKRDETRLNSIEKGSLDRQFFGKGGRLLKKAHCGDLAKTKKRPIIQPEPLGTAAEKNKILTDGKRGESCLRTSSVRVGD